MLLDELEINGSETRAVDAARYRRAECTRAIASVERAAHAPWKGRERAWVRGVCDALRELRDAFELHISVSEEPAGFLQEVVHEAPRMSHRAEQLRIEHLSLREALAQMISDLEGTTQPLDVEAARRAVLAVVGAASQHRRASSDLLYEAYEVDIGQGD